MAYDKDVQSSIYDKRLDLQNIRRIFTFGRPASSQMEIDWVNTYLFTPEMQAAGMYKDGFQYGRQEGEGEGNLIIEVGEGSRTLFSSHTDTVHRTGVIQNVFVKPTESVLKYETDSGQCLGGDDGTGIWLMLELIKAGVPGLYIFHRAEEVGGQGSSYIANQTPELLTNYDRAIAFDRKDDWSIITHQAGTRTCSDDFAKELADQLSMEHRKDSTGSFTDTANYDDVIPECTNLSVGYHNAHSKRENQEIEYVLKFRDALINVDWESLINDRDPSVPEYSTYGYYGYGDRLMKPKRAVREQTNWGDFEDQQFEKNRSLEDEKREKAGEKTTQTIQDDVIHIDLLEGNLDNFYDDDDDGLLDFLDKQINAMSDEEFMFYEMLRDGTMTEREILGQIRGEDVSVPDWDEDIDEEVDLEAFFDDYSPKGKDSKSEKDMTDYEDDDYEWDEWFKGGDFDWNS